MGEARARSALEVHGYCLLGNHYHLLIRSLEGRLADGMRWLSGRYTQQINYRDHRDGPLFRGRYTSVLIANDAHLVRVSRYIHLNPVDAGLTRHAEQWPWSSAAAYLDGGTKPNWLITDVILEMFGMADARSAYRDFLSAGVDQPTAEAYASLLRVPG